MSLALDFHRILVTAPRSVAARLAQVLISQGESPILMPTVAYGDLEDYTALDGAIQRLETFDWVAFMSRAAIDAMVQRLDVMRRPLRLLGQRRLCALARDAERLEALGIPVDVVPDHGGLNALVRELAKMPRPENQLILVPVSERVGVSEATGLSALLNGLGALGMRVTTVPAYRVEGLDASLYGIELGLLERGAIDAIALCSEAEVDGFLRMVPQPESYQRCAIACFGPHTADYASQRGLRVAVEESGSFERFAAAIASLWF